MKRYVAALLVVVGVVGLVGVLAVGTGFAEDENAAGAKCSKATLHGTYLFAYDGFKIKGNDQIPFAVAGYEVYNGNGNVNSVSSFNFNGKITRRSTPPARIPSRRIAQAPPPIRMVRTTISSSPPMVVS
jgi:hypothetical protein